MSTMTTVTIDYKNAAEGWVYCLVNYRDREQVKIGMTSKSMEQRLKHANGTFLSEGFYIAIAKYVKHPYAKEQTLHELLKQQRVSKKREFFDVRRSGTFERILLLFDLLEGDVHPLSKRLLWYGKHQHQTKQNSHVEEPQKQQVSIDETPSKTTFQHVFETLYEASDDSRDVVNVTEVIKSIEEKGETDVIVNMQRCQYYPTETRKGTVYRGLKRKFSFEEFAYTEEEQ